MFYQRSLALFYFQYLLLSLSQQNLILSMYSNILFENVEGIAHLTINRPDKLNALNIQTIEEIKQAFEQVYDDASIKAVIVTGTPPSGPMMRDFS